MNEKLLEIEKLTVRFRARRGLDALLGHGSRFVTAVDGVDLSVQRGEIVGLVGESGSGKTTFAKTVLRLEQPVSGAIRLWGHDLATLGEHELRPLRHTMQMVFQDPLSSLNPRQRVQDVMATPMHVRGGFSGAEIDARVDRTLRQVGLPSVFKGRYPHELSGGQLQRVAIGRALIVEPKLIVADEAVSKLDVSVRAQVLNLFKDIQREGGMSMLFITHDLHVARYLCDRIGVMYFGKLVELAPTEELFRHPVHPYTKALLGTVTQALGEGVSQSASEAFNPALGQAAGCRFLKRCRLRQSRCREAHPGTEWISAVHGIQCYEWRVGLAEAESDSAAEPVPGLGRRS